MKLTERSFFNQAETIRGTSINIATAADEAFVVNIISQAFRSDPVFRWVWPDLQSYLTVVPSFIRTLGGKAFPQGSAYFVDGYAGAALWLPPTVRCDEKALTSLLQRTVPEDRQADLFAMFEAMDRYHPSEPNWYLQLIGIDPAQQSRGYGSALMQYALLRCDRDKLPAYLEASSIRSVRFYQRHGFETIGIIQEGTSPPLFPMIRKPI